MRGDQAGQPVGAVHHGGSFPGQVIEPDMVEQHLPRRDAEQRGELPLEADRHVAQADGPVPGVEQRPGDDPDRVGEVDDPGALGARRLARSAMSRTTGTVRSALARPPAPVVSWPTQPHSSGQVSSRWRAAWPPTRSCSRTAPAPSRPSSRLVVQRTAAGCP
jgi:hypothetical protein